MNKKKTFKNINHWNFEQLRNSNLFSFNIFLTSPSIIFFKKHSDYNYVTFILPIKKKL